MPDPLFFVPLPHTDLHAVLNGPQLKMDVQMASLSDPTQKRYAMNSVFNTTVKSEKFTVEVKFLAQHNEPPDRFNDLPSVDPNTGIVTVTTPGVYLFRVKVIRTQGGVDTPIGRVVGRLQVHPQIVDWWFGNKSITTAKEDKDGPAHAQPTIYARFSPHKSGTDVVGDITGHNFVTLVPSDTTKVQVAAQGRLRGLVETTAPVTVTGTFLDKSHDLPVHVIDYTRTRGDELKVVQLASTVDLTQRSNMVFVAEGFRDTPADRALFTGTVKAAVKRMFTMPRHDPFSMLSHRYNVFQLFAPSQERGITTGFPVTDLSHPGLPIPYQRILEGIPTHTLAQLIQLVGLPARGETRSAGDLKTHWKKQRPELAGQLDGFPDRLIDEWKTHRADAFLDAVDSRFGMYLGGRFADGNPQHTIGQPADPPPKDNPADLKMQKFVNQLYTFFTPKTQIEVAPDPRRHPPELFGYNNLTNPGLSIMSYLAGQTFSHPFDLPGPGVPVGKEWVPDDTKPTLSRGLVVIVAYEDIRGGVALNNSTAVGVTVATKYRVVLGMPTTTQPERLSRVLLEPPPPPPAAPPPNFRQDPGIVNLDFFTNTFTHELGHNYALGDEYEALVDADPDEATFAKEVGFDNITRIGVVRVAPPPDRSIDPDKVKWLKLPRMRIASRLTQTAKPSGGTIEVRVNPIDIPQWTRVFQQAPTTPVSLRRYTSSEVRLQLPLKPTDVREFQDNLLIKSKPDPNTGAVVLSYPTALPSTPPEFPAGSALYVPQQRNQKPVFVVEEPVMNFLRTSHKPLNLRPRPPRPPDPTRDDNDNVGSEDPAAIPGFAAPASDTFRTVGIYEGANHSSLGYYRPTGSCKMRNPEDNGAGGAFCFVCRWLIVNAVDPGQHVLLDSWYPGGRHG